MKSETFNFLHQHFSLAPTFLPPFFVSFVTVSVLSVFVFYGLLITATKLPVCHYFPFSLREDVHVIIQAFKESHYSFCHHTQKKNTKQREDIKISFFFVAFFYQFRSSVEWCFVTIKIKQRSHHRSWLDSQCLCFFHFAPSSNTKKRRNFSSSHFSTSGCCFWYHWWLLNMPILSPLLS